MVASHNIQQKLGILTFTDMTLYTENMGNEFSIKPKIDRVRDEFGRYINVDSTNQNQDEELVDIKVHNPLKRIYQLLTDIKKHQETTFAFKFTIPLIALPVAIAILLGVGGFQLGRLNPVCQTSFTTYFGRLYSLRVVKPASSSLWSRWFSWLSVPQQVIATQTVLQQVDQTLVINVPKSVNIDQFHNQQVAISGELNPCTQVLEVSSLQNITPVSL